ncbi:hypothetical protein DV737_g5490, partial [Chaetothyriales sp. CBS 132003]
MHGHLPYNPHRIVVAKNGSLAYIFAPGTSYQASLSTLNISSSVVASDTPSSIFSTLPFLSDTEEKSFIPISDDDGAMKVLSGSCSESADGLELWQFTPSHNYTNGTWSELQVQTDDSSLSANFLSAGISFTPTTDSSNASLYIFGGMCPFTTALNASDWVSHSNYSDTMLTIQAASGNAQSSLYEVSITGTTSSPIAEAGLTMTPLSPWFSNSSTGSLSQQQDFVLLGGHTQKAFINMSQVAVFSLPQASWAFVTVEQPQSVNGELAVRDVTQVEPRSGHTAVLTEDGTRIVVLGGWVGDISTPAQPQLAVLNIGEDYGGVGAWEWITPTTTSNPYSGAGVYGHAAAMLPGGVMMVTGGKQISSSSSKIKRATYQDSAFFNTSSMTWSASYVNPVSLSSSAGSVSSSQTSSSSKKARNIGLGVGLGVGLAALAAAVAIYLWVSHKRRQTRAERERRLRKLALGTDKSLSPSMDEPDTHYYLEKQSASWHNMQERQMESSHANNAFYWQPMPMQGHQAPSMEMQLDSGGVRQAERTGAMMEVPSPTRGLRKNVISRGSLPFAGVPSGHAAVPGTVFRIDEEDEGSQAGSIRHVRGISIYSDPFKDPAQVTDLSKLDDAAEQRKRELQGWAEDWQSAAESLNLTSKFSTGGFWRDKRIVEGSIKQKCLTECTFVNWSGQSSPTKSTTATAETMPRRSTSTDQAFWRGKRGAKDWTDEFGRVQSSTAPLMQKSDTVIRRKPVPGQAAPEPEEPKSDDEWDIETAVQQRVVQVMFTVPKEKLRVINADSLSLLSSNRSDIGHDDDRDREREISKMSCVREGDEDDQADDEKGKVPVRD